MTSTLGTSRGQIQEVPLSAIHPNAHNPRGPVGDVESLRQSMGDQGLTQTVILMESKKGYTIIAGHRRCEAARQLEWESIHAEVLPTMTVADQLSKMLVENIDRDPLPPCREAKGFADLVATGLPQEAVAKRVGCNQSHVSRRLRLLELPEDLQAKVDAGGITVKAALKTLEPKRERPAKESVQEAETQAEAPEESPGAGSDWFDYEDHALSAAVKLVDALDATSYKVQMGDLDEARESLSECGSWLDELVERVNGPALRLVKDKPVTGVYVGAEGEPLVGTVTFTDTETGEVVATAEIVDGAFSAELPTGAVVTVATPERVTCPASDCEDGWVGYTTEEGDEVNTHCPTCNGTGEVEISLVEDDDGYVDAVIEGGAETLAVPSASPSEIEGGDVTTDNHSGGGEAPTSPPSYITVTIGPLASVGISNPTYPVVCSEHGPLSKLGSREFDHAERKAEGHLVEFHNGEGSIEVKDNASDITEAVDA